MSQHKGNRGDLRNPLEIAELSNFLETPPFPLILDHRGQLGLISFITCLGFIGAQVSYRLSLWHNSSEEKTMTRLVDGSEIYHFHQWSLLVHPTSYGYVNSSHPRWFTRRIPKASTTFLGVFCLPKEHFVFLLGLFWCALESEWHHFHQVEFVTAIFVSTPWY